MLGGYQNHKLTPDGYHDSSQGLEPQFSPKQNKKKTHRSDIYHSSENLEKSNNHQFFEDFEITRTDGSFSDFDFCQSTGTQKLFSIEEII